jgi:phosphoribosylformylglycinamidine cyclo-ligase
MTTLDYHSAGVNYDVLDQFKRHCQQAAGTTLGMLGPHGVTEPAGIRGESAYLVETPDEYLAHVEEGLGTKNLVADAVLAVRQVVETNPASGGRKSPDNAAPQRSPETSDGASHAPYYNIGIDTVAAIVNDLLTVGALPMVVAMHAAVGSAKWFENAERARDLAEGFAEGCRQAGAVWGGGETPALKGLVEQDAIILAGSAMGRIRPKNLRIAGDVQNGDAIILLGSSGVHANGLTLCRELATRLPQGYQTQLDSGRSYGDTLLDPSVIYSAFIRGCQEAGVPLHYAVHMTGHGWRKLMRLAEPWVYRLSDLGSVPEIFPFIQKHAGLDNREMYGTFNMGAGFAVYVAPQDAERTLQIARDTSYTAWLGGHLEKQGQRKAVEIGPLGIVFEGETLQIR